jgi:hypothetical protein
VVVQMECRLMFTDTLGRYQKNSLLLRSFAQTGKVKLSKADSSAKNRKHRAYVSLHHTFLSTFDISVAAGACMMHCCLQTT